MQSSRHDTRVLAVLALILSAAFLGFECVAYFVRDVHDIESAGHKPILVTEFGAGVPVAQSFSLLRDRLDSLTVSIASDQPAVIGFEFTLIRKGVRADWPDEPIAKRTVQLSVPAGVTWQRMDFEPVSRSKDRIFVATFKLTDIMRRGSSASDPKVALSAWADDALRGGSISVGGEDRWGDLAFSAQVDPPTRLARLSESLDAALGLHTGSIGASVTGSVYFGLLVVVCFTGFSLWRRVDDGKAAGSMPSVEEGETATRRSVQAAAPILLAVAMPILFTTILVTRERVTVDLLDKLDSARMESSQGMHMGFSRIEEVINGASPPALFAHPPSRVTWTVSVPGQQPWFRTSVALRPYVWEHRSDGVTFDVSVTDGTHGIKKSRFLDPARRINDRAWIEIAIDLSPYAGRTVDISLATSPGPSGDVAWDWAMWGKPRIISLRWFDRYGRTMRDLNRERSGD